MAFVIADVLGDSVQGLHLLEEKAEISTIFLRNTQNYVYRRIYVEYIRTTNFERAVTIFGPYHNVLNNNLTN